MMMIILIQIFDTSDKKDSFNFYFKSNRKIKRHNSQACNFRIKFNYDKIRLCYYFIQSKNLIHNHNPEIIENKVRLNLV